MKAFIRQRLIENLLTESIGEVFYPKTNLPDYDDVLSGKSPRIFEEMEGQVVQMTPEEYLKQCAVIQDTTPQDQLKYIDQSKVEAIAKKMAEGTKFNMSYLDYGSNKGQEGRHRVMAAKRLGLKTIPVAVFKLSETEAPEISSDLSEMIGKWSDVVKGQHGPAVVYDLNDWKTQLQFLRFFISGFDDYFLDDVLSNIIYHHKGMEVVDLPVKLTNYEWEGLIPEAIKLKLINSLRPILKRDDDMESYQEIENDDNFLISTLEHYGKEVKEPYIYMRTLASSISRLLIVNHNESFLKYPDFEGVTVMIDGHARRATIEIVDYPFHDFTKYNSGKELLQAEASPYIKSGDSTHYNIYSLESNEVYQLTKPLIEQFVKSHNF